uniref:IPPc domain-containing protein n=1 Tax=Panagrellus redivivus TaxID=6233 RepID=A0A7E4UQ77_PANRE
MSADGVNYGFVFDSDDPVAMSESVTRQDRRNSNCFYSRYNDDEFIKQFRNTPCVYGPRGVPLPHRSELSSLLKDSSRIKIMCFTWNINSRPIRSVESVHELFHKIPLTGRPDVFAIALQELPSMTLRFHANMVNGIESGITDTHQTFCWVRQWSQLLIVFMKKHLCLYCTRPEYQFVASSKVAKPFRTKGAIAICFRILQRSFVFISCHFSHESIRHRIVEYQKVCAMLNFSTTLSPQSPKRGEHSILNADYVFWFGDMNFRLSDRRDADELAETYGAQLFGQRKMFAKLLEDDELRRAQMNGWAFERFQEAEITFPPTYKYLIGSNKYSRKRIPSYTVCFKLPTILTF